MNNFEGIIIKQVPFKETSLILYLYTANGIDSVLVKGAKKLNSGTANLSDLVLRISYNKTKSLGLATLINYDILNSYLHLKKDITSLTYLNLILECVYRLNESTDTRSVYYFLVRALEMLDEGYDARIITDIFLVKYLYLLGLVPSFTACVKCGSNEGLAGFSIKEGGVVCKNHLDSETIRDFALVTYLAKCYYTSLEEIDFNYDPRALKVILDYYSYHLGIRFKSSELLEFL